MTDLYVWGGVLVTLILSALGIYRAGGKASQNKADRDNLEAYKDTRKEMDDAEIGNDPDAARRWLSERLRRTDD